MNWVVLTFEHPQCLIIKKIKNDRFRKKKCRKIKTWIQSITHTQRKERKEKEIGSGASILDQVRFNSRPSAVQFRFQLWPYLKWLKLARNNKNEIHFWTHFGIGYKIASITSSTCGFIQHFIKSLKINRISYYSLNKSNMFIQKLARRYRSVKCQNGKILI